MDVRMAEDWHVAAYDAGLRRDHDGMCATLWELADLGRNAMRKALRAWMDRTEYVMAAVSESHGAKFGFVLEADNGDGGLVDVDDAPRWVAWAGRMFMAHLEEDDTQWDALWAAVADNDLHDALHAALTMLTLTADAIAETAATRPAHPTSTHLPDPMTRAARMARAHLN